MNRAWSAAALAAALLAIPYAAFLGTHQLWQPYEPDLAEVAREMRESGDHVVPRLNGSVYADKPPLYYWSVLGAASLRGRLDETAARIPSAVFALSLIALTAFAGARRYGLRAGLLAGLILGTTPIVYHYGTAGTCDMPLAFATTASLLALHAATEKEPRGGLLVLAGALLGLSVMAKSLIGPVLIVLGGGPTLLLDEERRLPRWPWWVLAAAAAAAVALPWYVAVSMRGGGEIAWAILLRNTFGRFFTDVAQRGSVATYLGTIPLDLLPWTFFLPLLAYHGWRIRRDDPARWHRLRLLLAGSALVLVMLSLSRCRINKYALPLFPWLALAIAASVEEARAGRDDGRLERRLAVLPASVLAVVLACLAALVPAYVAGTFPTLIAPLAWAAPFVLLAAGGLFVVARTRPPRDAALALALVLAGGLSCAGATLLAPLDEIRSDRPLQAAIETFVPRGAKLATYRMGVRSYLIFYTGRLQVALGDRAQLERWLATTAERPAILLARQRDLEALRDLEPRWRLEVVGSNPPGVGHDDFRLLRISAR